MRLKKRSEFLAVAKGVRSARRGFVLQAATVGEQSFPPRIGYTVTKKTGNSPERNRIRRRLKAAWSDAAPLAASSGCDYVLIGRRAALHISFDDLVRDLTGALSKLKNQQQTDYKKKRRTPPNKG